MSKSENEYPKDPLSFYPFFLIELFETKKLKTITMSVILTEFVFAFDAVGV